VLLNEEADRMFSYSPQNVQKHQVKLRCFKMHWLYYLKNLDTS